VDIAYHVGVAGFAAFTQLIVECNALQFGWASLQVYTAIEGEVLLNIDIWRRRNGWRHLAMLEAAKEICNVD
jgi:hypothetical protein